VFVKVVQQKTFIPLYLFEIIFATIIDTNRIVMKTKIIALLILVASTFLAFSQRDTSLLADDFITKLQKDNGEGSVTIYQSSSVHFLHSKFVRINDNGKIDGWRVQIYNSSGKESKEEAKEIRKEFVAEYPDMKAYTVYQPPFFKLRVGDFRTKQEAYRFYRKILRKYPASYLVPDKIYLPEL